MKKTINDDHNNELDTDYLISLALQQEEVDHSHKKKKYIPKENIPKLIP